MEVQGLLAEQRRRHPGTRGSTRLAADELAKSDSNFDYFLKALVVGLGNEKVTPDSLGPHTGRQG